MSLFESYERRIGKINSVLAQYGISSVEECRELCQAAGFDPYEIVKGIQPIAFENAAWAYCVGAAIALSVTRIVLDFSLVYYVIPGYFISLALSLFVPPAYTAVAFDSGGVASGPMTSGFILPFAIGACVAMQGADAVLRDAFGVVALVAMTPLITIQLLGFRGIVAERVNERKAMKRILDADDQQIINFM